MNPDSYQSIRESTLAGERAKLAGHLNKLREYNTHSDGAEYNAALDDVAERMGLIREERVTYRA